MAQSKTLGFEDFVSSSGYDFTKELGRYRFPDVSIGNESINRGRCDAGVSAGCDADWMKNAYPDIVASLLPTTLRRSAPTVDITMPVAGHYCKTHRGIVFDAQIGVAQRLIDENHPRVRDMMFRLIGYHALLRREAATNDIIVANPASGIVTPQQLGALVSQLADSAFPANAPYKAYLCSSGAEAIEAAMKVACVEAHGRFIEKYGYDTEIELMRQVDIARNEDLDHPQDKHPLYQDYPFYFVSTRGAFHGRTLGALSLTNVRPVNKRGFPALSRVRRIDFNGNRDSMLNLVDRRDLHDILLSPGGVRQVLAEGRIPKDLIAGFVIEAFQGEGGYRLADRSWLRSTVEFCRENGISVIADEIQTFARTGRVFVFEHFGVAPDIVAISKASVLGVMLASSRHARSTKLGWHSTTWGGGKVLDNNFAWTVLDTYLNYQDPCFDMSYVENQRTKAEYIARAFEWLAWRHPTIFVDFRGLGGMWGFSVKRRDEVTSAAWQLGLKLLSCGVTRDVSSIRALFLADLLTKEVNCFARLLDRALTYVEETNPRDSDTT